MLGLRTRFDNHSNPRLWSIAALAFAFAASSALAGGGGGPARYGDNPNHEKGSMSGNVAMDCTNFRVTAAGVVSADCNTSTDTGVDPSPTTIDLGETVRVRNDSEGSQVRAVLQRHCTIYRPIGLLLTWANGDEHTSRWNDAFRDSCTDASIDYQDGDVWLEARCTLTDILVSDGPFLDPCYYFGAARHSGSLRTKLNGPEQGGGLTNSEGALALE